MLSKKKKKKKKTTFELKKSVSRDNQSENIWDKL